MDLTEDYNAGNSHSVALRKLFQRGRERSLCICVLAGEYVQSGIHLGKGKDATSHKEQYLKLMISVLLCVWEDARLWLHKNSS